MSGCEELERNIVAAGFCSGCGACVAVCPPACLAMRLSGHGELAPVDTGGCTSCGACLRVCPFAAGNPDTTHLAGARFAGIADMRHDGATGYYLHGFYGHRRDDDARRRASSGGLCTWLLEELLRRDIVDAVLLVAPVTGEERCFAYQAVTTPDGVRSAARSAYYPVDAAPALRLALEQPGRYALVGLPCVLRAVELLKASRPSLRNRVVVTLGLVCGQLKSVHYTRYAAALAGLREPLVAVDYREKQPGERAGNFFHAFHGAGGNAARIAFSDVANVWVNDWFKVHACNACDDIFAECADATLMDAWLPAYQDDGRGANLLLARNPRLIRLLEDGAAAGAIHLDPIDIAQVIASQRGVVENKRLGTACRRAAGMSSPRPARFAVPSPRGVRAWCRRWLAATIYRCKYRINLLTRGAESHVLDRAVRRAVARETFMIRLARRALGWFSQ